METKRVVFPSGLKTVTFVVSLSVFILFAVALLFAFASDLQSQVLLSVIALGWFTLVWCHISAVGHAFRSIRSAGTITSLTGLIVSFIVIWYEPTETALLWVQLAVICHILSYMCAHFAYFLNARKTSAHDILQALEITAIVSVSISGILALLFVLHDGNITSTFFYRMFISFVTLNVLSTVLYSILNRR